MFESLVVLVLLIAGIAIFSNIRELFIGWYSGVAYFEDESDDKTREFVRSLGIRILLKSLAVVAALVLLFKFASQKTGQAQRQANPGFAIIWLSNFLVEFANGKLFYDEF